MSSPDRLPATLGTAAGAVALLALLAAVALAMRQPQGLANVDFLSISIAGWAVYAAILAQLLALACDLTLVALKARRGGSVSWRLRGVGYLLALVAVGIAAAHGVQSHALLLGLHEPVAAALTVNSLGLFLTLGMCFAQRGLKADSSWVESAPLVAASAALLGIAVWLETLPWP